MQSLQPVEKNRGQTLKDTLKIATQPAILDTYIRKMSSYAASHVSVSCGSSRGHDCRKTRLPGLKKSVGSGEIQLMERALVSSGEGYRVKISLECFVTVNSHAKHCYRATFCIPTFVMCFFLPTQV